MFTISETTANPSVSSELFSLLYYGLIACCVVALGLALLPKFQPQCRTFSRRFIYFLWRYALPVWAFQEIVFRVTFGRFFP